MVVNTVTPAQRVVCIVLCESDKANSFALGQALRWQATCDRFVVAGKSEFIEDWFQSPYGVQAEFVESYDTTNRNVMVFNAAELAAAANAEQAMQRAYESFRVVVERVRELRNVTTSNE